MKQYIVIGGTAGIGGAITKQLSEAGHEVLVLSRTNRNLEGLDRVQHEVWDASGADAPGVLPAVADGLVYCPGSINLKPFHRLTAEDFMRDFQVNVLGAARALQHFMPALKAAPSASVVLFSTVAVQTGMPFHASVAAAKGAIEGLVRSLAAEWAPRIQVNAIAPSLVPTELSARLTSSDDKVQASAQRHPMQRLGTAEELAQQAVFLLTQMPWMTGQILALDGGMSSVRL
ncbi:MAG: SDR family oxidoreductase [Chitinophagales bacterium]